MTQPHIVLQDLANVKPTSVSPLRIALDPVDGSKAASHASQSEFQAFVDAILERSQKDADEGLLSPTGTGDQLSDPSNEPVSSASEAIDLAILRGNAPTGTERVATRFDISKAGARIAVVTLLRTSYKVGETIPFDVNFSDADLPCYALHVALESYDLVDSSVALRSVSSIKRATRQVHASRALNTGYARSLGSTLVIPPTATPSFPTSALEHNWVLRIEFMTSKGDELDRNGSVWPALLQSLSTDDRVTISVAAGKLRTDIFDVEIPLKIFGTTQVSGGRMSLRHLRL